MFFHYRKIKLFWNEKAPRWNGKDKVSMMTDETVLSENRRPTSDRRYKHMYI